MIKLNVGSNAQIIEGWINIDKYPSPGVALIHDATQPFPYADNSVDFIFSEHFIEHLSGDEGLFYFKECYRMLKPGGVVRTSTFNIDDLIKCCLNNNEFEIYTNKYFDGRFSEMTPLQFFNFAVYEGGGHKYMYNTEEMIRFLKLTGFQKFTENTKKISLYRELQNLEWRKNSTCIVEAIK